MQVNVQVNGQQKCLSLVVVRDGGRPLFGHNWLMEITMAWKVNFTCRSQGHDSSIVALSVSENNEEVENNGVGLAGLLRTYTYLYLSGGSGKRSGIVAKIPMKPGARPKFFKPCPIPYALKDRIEQDLDRLITLVVIEPIPYSEWVVPIEPVIKANGWSGYVGILKLP